MADEVTARTLERYFKSGSGKAFAKELSGSASCRRPNDRFFAATRRSIRMPVVNAVAASKPSMAGTGLMALMRPH
jgi:hypothetical protein